MKKPGAELETAIESLAREMLRDAPPRLKESVLYSLLGPGKRIRPRLVLAMGEAFKVPMAVSLRIATAIEMIHAYTLVHDDLPAMDNDDLRRGRPTNHKVFGEGLAVLAGDSLALLGPDTLISLRNTIPSERVLDLVTTLLEAAGARGVIAGQAAEIELASTDEGRSRERLFEIFRLKTGALFRASLTMPAIAAGTAPEIVTTLGHLGDSLGIAFQIADDLEDDFVAKRSDPVHTAAYCEAEEARKIARNLLNIDMLSPTLREKLSPFLTEFRRKIDGVSP